MPFTIHYDICEDKLYNRQISEGMAACMRRANVDLIAHQIPPYEISDQPFSRYPDFPEGSAT